VGRREILASDRGASCTMKFSIFFQIFSEKSKTFLE